VVEAEVDEIMAIADLNGNGELDYSEWLVATLKRSDIINMKKLHQAFQYFDKDNSGKISLEELKEAMGSNGQELDEEVFIDILAEGDENGDGEIDFEEFKNMMKKLLGRPADERDKQKDQVI
jgi:calcium-dependent protein kinase